MPDLNAVTRPRTDEGQRRAEDLSATERAKREWAAEHGLRESRSMRGDPVLWLLGRRTPPDHHHTHWPGQADWFDHGTRWLKDGRPHMLVGQPYQLEPEDLEELAALARDHDLDVWISTYPDWHYPGSVLSVTVTPNRGGNP